MPKKEFGNPYFQHLENKSNSIRNSFIIGMLGLILILTACASTSAMKAEGTALAATHTVLEQTVTAQAALYGPTAQYVQEIQDQRVVATATYLASNPDDIDSRLKNSSIRIWPGNTTIADDPLGDIACSATVLDVREFDHDSNPETESLVATTSLTMLHCLTDETNKSKFDSFVFQSIYGDYIATGLLDYEVLDGLPNTDGDYPVVIKTTSFYKDLQPLQKLDNNLEIGTSTQWGYSTYDYCGFPAVIMSGSSAAITDLYCQTLTYAGMEDGLVALNFQLNSGGSGGAIQENKNKIICVGSDSLRYRIDEISYCAPIPQGSQEKAVALMNR